MQIFGTWNAKSRDLERARQRKKSRLFGEAASPEVLRGFNNPRRS